jgi:hypothetical protein
MDARDAAEREFWVDASSPHKHLLAEAIENVVDYAVALQELASHTLATSPAGLRYRAVELAMAHEDLADDARATLRARSRGS